MISTQPTMIAVAAPIAVTFRPRNRSSANHVTRLNAGVSVLVNASTLRPPVELLPLLNPNHLNHSSPAPIRT